MKVCRIIHQLILVPLQTSGVSIFSKKQNETKKKTGRFLKPPGMGVKKGRLMFHPQDYMENNVKGLSLQKGQVSIQDGAYFWFQYHKVTTLRYFYSPLGCVLVLCRFTPAPWWMQQLWE